MATAAACSSETNTNKPESGKIIVCIDNGSEPITTKEVKFSSTITALEALQKAAIVKTHPVKDYVFVSSIDSIQNIRGVKAWYYKVNGKSPKKLAIKNQLQNGDTLLWIYKEDVCSKTVDK